MKSNTLRIVIIVALIVGVAIVIASKEKPAGKQPPGAQAITTQPASTAKLPKMLELGSTTCTPCKMMEKVMDELRKEYPSTLAIEFVNTEERPDMAKKYKIELIPTQVFFDASGKEIDRHVGFFPKEDIVALFAKHGIKLSK
jgi:thioredoxin 1